MTTKNEEIYHSILLDDREPLQLAIEMEKYGHEVEVKRLKTGDFEGKTTIGEIKRGEERGKLTFIVGPSSTPSYDQAMISSHLEEAKKLLERANQED